MAELRSSAAIVEEAFERRAEIGARSDPAIREAVEEAIRLLDDGRARIAEKQNGEWIVNEWLKKAVLLSFRIHENRVIDGGPGGANWWDRVAMKSGGWCAEDFKRAGYRSVPGSIVRRGAYVAPSAILMPSFVNIGAHIGEGTMIDTWASVGSCAQIGARCHISAGTGIGGVLEPPQASPTIVEDNCFIGARSEIVEGVIVGEGSVIAMGVFITQSTKIVERDTGKIHYGRIPPYSVVVPGALPSVSGPSLACAVIVKRVDEKTRAKTAVNELLRD
ncbi:MAG: 2,3,4,5-tetrahydropyridine-2,6-dicarboxylate N-succinyltransferase [Parvularculaceae bacterium]